MIIIVNYRNTTEGLAFTSTVSFHEKFDFKAITIHAYLSTTQAIS